MNFIDIEIISYLNQFSRLSWTIDLTVKFISGNHLIKGGVLLAVFWWGWFKISKNQQFVQVHLVATLFGCFVAMVLGLQSL